MRSYEDISHAWDDATHPTLPLSHSDDSTKHMLIDRMMSKAIKLLDDQSQPNYYVNQVSKEALTTAQMDLAKTREDHIKYQNQLNDLMSAYNELFDAAKWFSQPRVSSDLGMNDNQLPIMLKEEADAKLTDLKAEVTRTKEAYEVKLER